MERFVESPPVNSNLETLSDGIGTSRAGSIPKAGSIHGPNTPKADRLRRSSKAAATPGKRSRRRTRDGFITHDIKPCDGQLCFDLDSVLFDEQQNGGQS